MSTAERVREPSIRADYAVRGTDHDNIVFLREASWDDFQALLRMRGENSAPRLSYLRGEVEMMSPSRTHESIKSIIGRLVEVYCLERGVRFRTLGAWTLASAPDERAAEPDECWIFGDADADRPHLVIEVEWTSGRIDKLDIYRKLGVAEVWWWRKDQLTPYALDGEHYVALDHSRVLPALDLPQLASFLDQPTAYDAIRAYRAALVG
ncbi:MAG: Uma2 family endonuclease [Thiohalocapsa sp.]|jgi:Uma2 family endonuclease|uniref:Uma2 family endonuclease n=1 Tax=Thiohalocapsa sp. TaxID=2497641 RepID=UPI0025ED6100|nr:Uma2 family endonuclease [Thiohalocapsa sp.]MCG6942088.1 Uma2 family endonuclease [Thiohalocapsa sp.]